MEKEQSNRLDQIIARQKQLEDDYQKTEKEKKIFRSYPPISRDIITKIIINQNIILVNNDENLIKYLKISYCVPTLTKNKYQEATQS